MRRLRVIVAAVAAIAVVAGTAVLRGGRKLKRFQYWGEPLSEESFARLGGGGWETRTLEIEPSVVLRGLVRPPATRGAPWVLFFSGNGGTVLADSKVFLDALRGAEDIGLAAYAYRGFDGSTGTPTPDALASDGRLILERLRKSEEVAGAPVHVIGFSLGAAIAAHVAAHPLPGAKAASLTLLAPLTEIEVGRPSRFSSFLPADRYETLSCLADVPAPALVVHGDADDALPVEMGREVKRRLGDRARYVELPGVGHLELPADKGALEAVREMIRGAAR